MRGAFPEVYRLESAYHGFLAVDDVEAFVKSLDLSGRGIAENHAAIKGNGSEETVFIGLDAGNALELAEGEGGLDVGGRLGIVKEESAVVDKQHIFAELCGSRIKCELIGRMSVNGLSLI